LVSDEATTLALGGTTHQYAQFRNLEGDPHGSAHVSFTGAIQSIGTAATDPVFFMLHANVDRLWAKWQWLNHRFDVTKTSTFTPLGSAASPGAALIGHNFQDTMWPWNQVTGPPRPLTAPGGRFPPSLLTSAPGLTPRVGDLIDYQGVRTPGTRLGFDYDDVPFEV
jgi:tyrosinase